ncbi:MULTISPECIES: PTS lactose/cellobiose transporter subunit IIA [Bacillaceae]|uniref:PTS cellobiose transporter subunit IIA n=1 Tax=Gottfriedia luciferensis TaxID=178774 RepID=A0ABX2ZLK1_9BACI|nr:MULTISPECIES: PTS lactose/cellobiose transporter subunit IIA [Bacillaceae]ODG90523.1 PTS cellobiose transporter subunit IIA [Gottfriedia luciferensis]PGZ94254.1 PTS lactose/cellobiose transporter subunit IIA [Bacillus sp. AFS029533]SFD20769.1 PTS system, cellobiose-specific IIA component [Bacillus sp. UNCCL81]
MPTDTNNEQIAFQLILHSGNAKSLLMEAMYKARDGKFEEARSKVNEANAELKRAHHSQTSLIQSEAGGQQYKINILLVHAQDHLMNTLTTRDLVEEIIYLHEKISL